MTRREFLAAACAGAAMPVARSLMPAARAAADRPPNFIVILADDLGAAELGCYGHPSHKTPHLDKLAETGVKFETCYAAPICHPSRVMLLTGQYGCHNGVYNFAGRRGGPDPAAPAEDMARGQVSFINELKRRGYATGVSGKWQLSGTYPNLVRECGFDEYCIWANESQLPPGTEYKGGREGARPGRYWRPCLLQNGEYRPTTLHDYGPDLFSDFAIDFCRRHKDEPFVMYYSSCLTHSPHMPTPAMNPADADKFKDDKNHFGPCLEYLDSLVGKLTAALDEMGLRENTVLFFTGDNGTGGHGKGEGAELGARVPMIINAPGIVKTRGVTPELTDLSDVFPTLLDFAGAPAPENRPIDGVSLKPFLTGKSEQTRDWIFSFIGDRRILRDKRWLLEDNSPRQSGRYYDCGASRNGAGYRDVTTSEEPDAVDARERFAKLLEKLPAPLLDYDGPPAAPTPDVAARKQRRRENRRNRNEAE